MTEKVKIYLASPLGFSEAGRSFMYGRIIPLIEELDYLVLDPWKLTPDELVQRVLTLPFGPERSERLKELNNIIGKNNMNAIKESKGLVAVLDGSDVDSGTASEIGYASAMGKPILGYRSDFRISSDKEGSMVNLQVEYFISLNGGKIITKIDDLQKELRNLFDK